MSQQQMISCIAWIPRGAAKVDPELYEMPDEAVANLVAANNELNLTDESETASSVSEHEHKGDIKGKKADKKAQGKGRKPGKGKGDSMAAEGGDDDDSDSDIENPTNDQDEILKRLKLDEYDDEEEIDEEDDEAQLGRAAQLYYSGQGLTPFENPTQDPNIVNVLDEEDAEEQRVRPNDSCILVGSTTDGDSSIEVYLFDEKTSNLYVHHEIVLPSFPLCVQWLNANPRATMIDSTTGEYFPPTGSFCAVGTFRPGIEIWNCDVMNPLEPVTILGGEENLVSLTHPVPPKTATKTVKGKNGKLVKIKTESKKLRPGSHTDAVMSLAWHPQVPARLASGSADKTVKLWDVTTQQAVYTARHHKDKVQSLSWHDEQLDVLLTGSYDRRVYVVDTRQSEADTAKMNPAFVLNADVEMVRWNPADANQFIATAEDGSIVCCDVRATNSNEYVWKLQAHEKACTSITFNTAIPTMFATSSLDKTVKIWDSKELVESKSDGALVPELLAVRNLNVGKLFAMQFDVSNPFILAAGGDAGCLAIWDTLENVNVNERYGKTAEELGLGDQTLPEDYVEMQRAGGQSRGIGPGVPGQGGRNDDDDSDHDDYGLLGMDEEMKDAEDDEAEENDE